MKKEQHVIILMKLFTSWLNVWTENCELPPEERLEPDFGLVQIRGLQVRLKQLEEHLEKSKFQRAKEQVEREGQ